MKREHTGPIREMWNYFKRGKSELNFLLNVYQTIILIWGVDAMTKSDNTGLIIVTIGFGVFIFILSLIIGKYSLTTVDPALIFINPFNQDIVVFRGLLAEGLELMANGDTNGAREKFRKGAEITDRWTAEKC